MNGMGEMEARMARGDEDVLFRIHDSARKLTFIGNTNADVKTASL